MRALRVFFLQSLSVFFVLNFHEGDLDQRLFHSFLKVVKEMMKKQKKK